MSLSINNYSNITTDNQRKRATEFVNRNDREVTKMASRAYNIAHREDDKRFVRNLRTGIFALPAVALASGLMLKKGIKPSLKNSAEWGIAIMAPAVVSGASKAMSKPDVTGKKHSNLSFGTHFILSFAGYMAGGIALNKLAKNEKFNKLLDGAIEGIKSGYKGLKNKVPQGFKDSVAELKSSIKTSKYVKPMIDSAKNSENFQKVFKASEGFGKKAIKNAPWLLAFGMLGATLYSGIKQGLEISNTKSRIKNAQLETARNVIESYKQENEALKA